MTNLVELYAKLLGLAVFGFILGRKLPLAVPTILGHFLFWVGVPISIIAFLRKADLSGQIWIAPVFAYLAIFLGAFFAWLGMRGQAFLTRTFPQQPTQGSFLLAAMVGNTGYLGFPITLALVGKEYFAWALFYDLLGTLFGAYGLGVAIAARFGGGTRNYHQVAKAVLINPALWSFGFGLLFRQQPIPALIQSSLEACAWMAIALSLILIGMRLSQLNSLQSLPGASITLGIKMIIVPLLLGSLLPLFGLSKEEARVILLQMAMPPAFATLVIAETYNLDRDLAVTALAGGSLVLLITLPVWLWLF